MPTHLLALVSVIALIPADFPRTVAQPRASWARAGLVPVRTCGSLRTDRLSSKQLKAWNKIVEVVMADDRAGQPLHPTLRRLWDAVDSSGHLVYIEMPDRKGPSSYIAGRFAVTKVDPEGKAHEAILILNLRAIDKVSTDSAAARASGFIPFKGLGKKERYAELLGHELAHAVWHLADTERARLAKRLQPETERRMHIVLSGGGGGSGDLIQEEVVELDRLGRELEGPAEAAEMAIWKELQARRRAR